VNLNALTYNESIVARESVGGMGHPGGGILTASDLPLYKPKQ